MQDPDPPPFSSAAIAYLRNWRCCLTPCTCLCLQLPTLLACSLLMLRLRKAFHVAFSPFLQLVTTLHQLSHPLPDTPCAAAVYLAGRLCSLSQPWDAWVTSLQLASGTCCPAPAWPVDVMFCHSAHPTSLPCTPCLQLSTFLAFKGLANETDCTGSLTWDEWEWWLPAPPAHPKTYPAAEVNDALLQKIRAHDDNMCWMFPDAISTSAQLFTTPQLLLGGSSSGCQLQGGNYTFMPSFCSIFARKFKEDAAAPMLKLMRGLPANISIFQGPTFPQNSTVWTCGDSGPGSGSQAAQSLEAQSASGADAGMSLAQQIPTRHLLMQHREPQVLAGTGRRHTAPTLEFE